MIGDGLTSGVSTGDAATSPAVTRPVPSADGALAIVVARSGALPGGAAEAVAEAGGHVLVVGSGARAAAGACGAARASWWCETGAGFRVAALSSRLAPVLGDVELLVLPASPDGRDLAPRLAATLGRSLIAGAVSVGRDPGSGRVRAVLSRLESRLTIDVAQFGPAVATLLPGSRTVPAVPPGPALPGPVEIRLPAAARTALDVEVVDVLEPDPATMDLGDATRVLAGGAGLVPAGTDEQQARAIFELLAAVAAALGASAGATRVVTDAGWMGHERQIGTTGVAVDPELYVALGISGASQHTGGLGAPRHVVSVNTDPSSPMTAMADLGLVTDARELLVELAARLGVPVGPGIGRPLDQEVRNA